jgi:hypothetical protein
MIYSLHIQGHQVESFRTFCQALAFCRYHNIHRGLIRMAGCIVATIHDGEAV